jgi:hypothetical protein
VVAVLHRHVPDDTYRFPPATDYTGRNVYRASLLRLENLEKAHPSLERGVLDDVIAFAKGRALERLRAFDLAATSYRRAAETPGELREEALASAALCDALADANRLGSEDALGAPADLAVRLAALDERAAKLAALEPRTEGSHYAAIVQEEIEHTQVARTHLVVAARPLSPDGDLRALAALQQLVVDQRDSKNANAHLRARVRGREPARLARLRPAALRGAGGLGGPPLRVGGEPGRGAREDRGQPEARGVPGLHAASGS